MKLRVKTKLYILFFLVTGSAISQNDAQQTFLNTDLNNLIDAYYIKYPAETFHSSMKPYIGFGIKEADDTAFHLSNYKLKNQFFRNDFHSDPKYKNRFSLQVLPQLDEQVGYDGRAQRTVNELSGGAYVRLDVNNNFSAALTAIGGQVSYPGFTDTIVSKYKIIPGLGRAHGSNGVYTFTNFTGYVSYSPIKSLNFQLAKDKIFIGDGYRSLLLSDIANSYPFLKTTINIWHLQYSFWYSWMQDVYSSTGIRKNALNRFGTFHYLSWNVSKNFNFSFFETEIFQGTDSIRHRGFDPNYLNPLIFYRPVEYSLGSGDNALLGFNTSVKFAKHFKLYGQVIIDEFNFQYIKQHNGWWANKQGFQLGGKYVDAFGVKNLSLQAEFNWVRPYTYSHASEQQNYSQYNQPLADPFGANFSEFLGFVSYKRKNWQIDLKGMYTIVGRDTTGSKTSDVGQNIFLNYDLHNNNFGNFVGQGIKYHYIQGEFKFTYFLIRGLNLRLEAGIIERYTYAANGYSYITPYVYAGIKTSMYNFYRDY
jgi:hypothetical protein